MHFVGADGIKWMSFAPMSPQIYVIGAEGAPLSLVSAAPMDTDIPLGVIIPEPGDYAISLPYPEAYSDYAAVWVIDKEAGTKANLLDQDFVLSTPDAGSIDDRLLLRFASTPNDQFSTFQLFNLSTFQPFNFSTFQLLKCPPAMVVCLSTASTTTPPLRCTMPADSVFAVALPRMPAISTGQMESISYAQNKGAMLFREG